MNAAPGYAEFAIQSNFSFLRGASKPEELAVTARRLGIVAMGLADRNTVAGTVRAWQQAKEAGLPYHPGSRLVFSDGTPDMLAYPQHRKGWGHLCRMLTEANLAGEKGTPDLQWQNLLDWGDGMALAVLPDFARGKESLETLRLMKQKFGRTVRVAVAPSYGGDDRLSIEQAAALAEAAGLPLMAVNDVLYHDRRRRSLQDVVTAIRLKVKVVDGGFQLAANAERHLKSPQEMARLFRAYPQAIAETMSFAESLAFDFSELKYNYPDEPTRDGASPQAELERLAWEGSVNRFPDGVPPDYAQRIRDELSIIEELSFARYFLTVYEIVKYARSKDILCQGRGSAANSVVCYCVGITDVGPEIMDTLFERFISRERGEPPDIDVDFEHERREEVMQFIYSKYSAKRTALAAAVISYRSRSAMREVAKAMGLSEDTITALSSNTWRWTTGGLGSTEAKSAGLDLGERLTKQLFKHANDIMGFPRHLSQHSGGFVITRDRLDEIVPIMKTAMPDRKMVEWDKDDLDSVGILKVDILALGMLTCLKKCFDLLKSSYPEEKDPHGSDLELATLPKEDPRVYDMIVRADTLGVFQIESRAQMTMLPRLKPRKFYDLVIEVAIVRPGPIQGDMVHPYLRRREEKEAAEYPKPELREILGKTLGVPLFQEQAMRIAIVAGGFSPDKADKLRRAMATFRRVGTIGSLRLEMIEGMVGKGYERDFAERCFKQIEGFGEYGFPESHAASFALLVYASCWFKAFYPDVFCAAILNSQPMGFYAPAQLVRDAIDHGVEIREVDVNHSDWDCMLESSDWQPARLLKKHAEMQGVIRTRHAVRLGLRQIKGLSKESIEAFVSRRSTGYDSVRDVWLRSGLNTGEVEKLAHADAFRSIGIDRREALWAVRAFDGKNATERLPLFERPDIRLRDNEPETRLPTMPLGEHVIHDYRTLSLSLKAHPVSLLRHRLDAERVMPCVALSETASGRRVCVAGLVLVRQRPGSAKGVIFMTIEDENGIANIIVWPKIFERFRSVVLGARFVRIRGKLQSQSGVIHVVADQVDDLTPWLGDLSEAGGRIGGLANADEVKRPVTDSRDRMHPTAKLAKLVREMPELRQDLEALAKKTAGVMPKGRNFQ